MAGNEKADQLAGEALLGEASLHSLKNNNDNRVVAPSHSLNVLAAY